MHCFGDDGKVNSVYMSIRALEITFWKKLYLLGLQRIPQIQKANCIYMQYVYIQVPYNYILMYNITIQIICTNILHYNI